MHALIVHYHLKPGGVTTVIRRQVSALAERGIDASLLVGEPAAHIGASVAVEPALMYDQDGGREPDPRRVRAIVSSIEREARALGRDTVIHVHNPTIRKNASMLAALSEIAESGRSVLLQVHDLAEDWRPDVYAQAPYPHGARWAAINRFDQAAIGAAIGSPQAVTFLPNPVPTDTQTGGMARPGHGSDRPRGPGLVLYPVRGIRRKNLGEILLLSMFARPGASVAATLPPNKPEDMPRYAAWRSLAATLGAPARFDQGLEHGLDELYARATAVVSTSIKEGFGLSYLEPMARGRVTLGRRLGRVIVDFEDEGLSFPALYERLVVPAGLFDADAFASRATVAVNAAARNYGVPERGEQLARAVVASVLESSGAGPDFGRLDEEAQTQVLREVAGRAEGRARILAANPFLDGWDAVADSLEPPPPEMLEPWSERACADRLAATYRQALDGDGYPAPDKARLLSRYLVPESFHGVGI
jgi:hypothetical protein